MARPMTPNAILRKAQKEGILPPEAEVLNRGRARWAARSLRYTLVIDHGGDNLTWILYVGDGVFGPAMDPFGGLAIAIVPTFRRPIPWPSGTRLPGESVQVWREDLVDAVEFVKGRDDLASLLCARSDVRRSGCTATLDQGSYPARLVMAWIIANDLGNDEIQDEVRKRLLNGDTIELGDNSLVPVAKSAQSWAKQYEKALGFPVRVPK